MSAEELGKKKEALIDAFFDRGALLFGDFQLASGKRSDYYIDVKRLLTEPKILKLIGELIIEETKGKGEEFDRVAGPELGAVPLATAISLLAGKPLVIVRKRPKGHGTGSMIEGDVNEGERILLVEDVTTTGGSVLKAAKLLESLGGKVTVVCTVVDREEGARARISSEGYRFISLLRVSEILDAAKSR